MLLDYGGDDITEFLHDLLKEIKFPYKNIKLNRLYDLHVMDDLKARLCTLSEVRPVESVVFSRRFRIPCMAFRQMSLQEHMISSSVRPERPPKNIF